LSPAEASSQGGSGSRGGPAGASGQRKRAVRSEEAHEIGAVLEGLLGQPPWASGISLGELGRRWGSVVGERLGQETDPVALEGGVLLIRASSTAWAAQIRFLSSEVQTRANEVLGGSPIRDVKVTVDVGPVDR
jgi:predicted nucleic acid-binding Zn ribbon protein